MYEGKILEDGKFNVVFGGQAGSEGKGKVSTYIAIKSLERNPNMAKCGVIFSCNHMPNAGHTFKHGDLTYVARQLPTPAILNKEKFRNNFSFAESYMPVVIGPGSAINLKILEEEIETCSLEPGKNLFIHPNAGIVTNEHIATEGKVLDNVSSTKKGGGACLCAKIMRQPESDGKHAIARDLLPSHLRSALRDTSKFIIDCMTIKGMSVLHEGAQGFDLDLNHGLDYPYVTSRMTNVSACMAEAGVPPSMSGSRVMVIRPYPIRVGDAYKDGNKIGTSGGYADDNHEISWKVVSDNSNCPEELQLTEKTTVTGKIRRVFTFSKSRFIKSMMVNDPTHIVLTFGDYIDYSMKGVNDSNDKKFVYSSPKLMEFIRENTLGKSMCMVSTGPENDEMIEIMDVF